MIHLYTWKTPNGRKVPIALEELHRKYQLHAIDIGADEQFDPAFLELSSNNKIPAIVDERTDGRRVVMFESGAILQYVAEDNGALLGNGPDERLRILTWLHWQIGGLGPMLGQLGHFALHAPEAQPYAAERFRKEGERLLTVMERQLERHPYLGGSTYSIADIAAYPWVHAARSTLAPVLERGVDGRAALRDWCDRVGARPSVAAGMGILESAWGFLEEGGIDRREQDPGPVLFHLRPRGDDGGGRRRGGALNGRERRHQTRARDGAA